MKGGKNSIQAAKHDFSSVEHQFHHQPWLPEALVGSPWHSVLAFGLGRDREGETETETETETFITIITITHQHDGIASHRIAFASHRIASSHMEVIRQFSTVLNSPRECSDHVSLALLPLLHMLPTRHVHSQITTRGMSGGALGTGMAIWGLDNADPDAFGPTFEPGRQDR